MKLILSSGWFYNFILGWIVFFLLVDWHSFKKNVWAGIVCIILELFQDGLAVHFGLYRILNGGIYLLGTSAFFTFGLAFTMGVIFMQYLPCNKILQLIHILVFAFGFVIFEVLLTKYGLFIHYHYTIAVSIFLNVIIIGSLAWLKPLIYRPNIK